jgi:ABC-2 type transport system ATP-binding protein
MLQIKHLSKTYRNGKKAVDDLSLHVLPGDIYGFIGHNGAGKTTTLRACVGVLTFDQGEILIDGHSIQDEPVLCKGKMAFIPDNPEIYPFLTGIQYLTLISDIYGVNSQDRQRRIEEYATRLELFPNLSDLVSSYSHGMKQKLAIISALTHEPKLLLLDEPFVGLDPKAAFTVKAIMQELCSRGSAVFFSTHVLEVAEKLCNKIAIIRGGSLVVSGSTQDVRGNSSLEEVFMELIEHEQR